MLGEMGQHASSHITSAHFDTSHGHTNAILLTAVLAHHQASWPPCWRKRGPAGGRRHWSAAGGALEAIARLRDRQWGAPSRLA